MNNLILEPEGLVPSYMDKIAHFESKLKFDPPTYQHSLQVANLSVQLLKHACHEQDENLIYYAGLFHDIGKSITPITLLKKKSPLSCEEFDQIKEHAKQGFRILQKYGFPSDVLFAALLHHEKYDGSGYPIGFIGKEIPIIARIVTICDVYEALTSERPYRKAFSAQEAVRIMESAIQQFDPVLIDLFLTGIETKKIKKISVMK